MNLIPRERDLRRAGESGVVMPLLSLWSEIDELFERLINDPRWRDPSGRGGLVPAIDLKDEAAELTVTVELPGVEPEKVEVSVNGSILTIQGEKVEATADKSHESCCSERVFGSFRRDIELPHDIEVERIGAQYKDGVLRIHLPRRRGSDPRKIPISAGKVESDQL